MNDVWLASGSVNIFIDTVKQINNKVSENAFSNNLFCSGFWVLFDIVKVF